MAQSVIQKLSFFENGEVSRRNTQRRQPFSRTQKKKKRTDTQNKSSVASQVNIPPWAIMTAFPMPSPKPLCDFRLSLGDFPFFFLEIVRRALCFCRRLSAVRWSHARSKTALKFGTSLSRFFWGVVLWRPVFAGPIQTSGLSLHY